MTLPGGWSWISLEDLIGEDAPIVYGIIQAGPEVSNGIPYIRPTELVDGGIDIDSLKRTSPVIASRYSRSVLRAGDVVLAIVGTIGKLAIVPPELEGANITQSSARLRPPHFMPSAYLAAALRSPQLRAQFDSMEFGVAVRRLNIAHVRALRIPVAPANEQRRIVAKLDDVFDQTCAAKARIERVPELLEKLKRSMLSAAFRGDLTKDWRAAHLDVEPASALLDHTRAARHRRREDVLRAKGKDPKNAAYDASIALDTRDLPDLPPGWLWTSAGELIDRIEAGRSPKAHGRPAKPGEQGVLKVSAVSWGRFLPEENKALISGDVAEPELLVRRGDLLISRANTVKLVGAVVIVEDDFPNLMLSDKTLRLVPSAYVDREFLLYAFRTQQVRRIFEEDATGTSDSMRNLSQDKIRAVPIAVAPLGEQREIARLLRDAFTIVDAIAERGEQAEARCHSLEEAALAKAFRGELVPQDPSDEPASVLLDRIRSARAAEPAQVRRKHRQAVNDGTVAATESSNGHPTNGHHDESVDLVVGMFQVDRRHSVTTIASGTGLESSAVKKALKVLVDSGQVSVEGTARSAMYIWTE